jgi:hypothetical protein
LLNSTAKLTSLLSYHNDRLFCYSNSLWGILWSNKEQRYLKFKQLLTYEFNFMAKKFFYWLQSPQDHKDHCIFMQVINDIVLFLSCYNFVLPPHKRDIPGRRSALQCPRGL